MDMAELDSRLWIETEKKILSPYAAFSDATRGREREEQDTISVPPISGTATASCTVNPFAV